MSNPPAGDKRSVTTDALATLGTILNPGEKRDAIHLAVEPVIAGQFMHPGDHINVARGVAMRCEEGKGLGIVDPFIIGNIKEGQRFWFVMYPRQVHSLRHVWTHPDFPDEIGTPAPAVAPMTNKKVSEDWLRQYAARVKSYEDPDEAYTNLLDDLKHKRVFYHGTDLYSREDLIDAAELAFHASVVLGIHINFDDEDFQFSCSC